MNVTDIMLPDQPFKILEPLYSSQSATSCYMECPRRYLFQYRLYGTGIVPSFSSVPLLAGGCLHKAVENIAIQYLNRVSGEVDLEQAVAIAQESYRSEISKRPLTNPLAINFKGPLQNGIDADEEQFVIQEQMALVEAMVRLWYLKEWPKIIEHYDILAVEQEITFQLGPVIYQSKPDLILLHKKNGDVTNYSLKSIKQGGDRLEKSYKVQLQAITEPYATSIWLRELAEGIGGAKESLDGTNLPAVSFLSKGLGTINRTLEKYSNLPTRSSSTRFCYLIKGDRKETQKGNGIYRTDNPFIYGLRKITPSGIQYAWTWWTKNPENKSGYGRLGKGWEQFPIWQDAEVGGVKGWMEKLGNGEVQGDIGDGHVFDKHILSQPDVFSNWNLIESRITQLRNVEIRIHEQLCLTGNIEDRMFAERVYFPMNTNSCFFPTPCDYLTICPNGNDYYKQHIAENPLDPEFAKYERRVSHHQTEKESIEEIEKGKEVQTEE